MSSHALAPQFESVGLALPLATKPRPAALRRPPAAVRAAAPVQAPQPVVVASLGGHAWQPAPAQAISLRRRCVDVVLVTVWAALIPGLMWIGHYAGF